MVSFSTSHHTTLFNLLLYSLITLPEVLNVHSDGTDVAGTARMDLANFDNWGYLVRALLFHQVRKWNSHLCQITHIPIEGNLSAHFTT